MKVRKRIVSLALAAGVAGAGWLVTAPPASGQVVANNLVGLNISGNQVVVSDVADVGANVAVPVGVAANVCGVSVPVLSSMVANGPTVCDADTTAETGDQSVRQNQALAFINRPGGSVLPLPL